MQHKVKGSDKVTMSEVFEKVRHFVHFDKKTQYDKSDGDMSVMSITFEAATDVDSLKDIINDAFGESQQQFEDKVDKACELIEEDTELGEKETKEDIFEYRKVLTGLNPSPD